MKVRVEIIGSRIVPEWFSPESTEGRALFIRCDEYKPGSENRICPCF
jgi:hypothetical protein